MQGRGTATGRSLYVMLRVSNAAGLVTSGLIKTRLVFDATPPRATGAVTVTVGGGHPLPSSPVTIAPNITKLYVESGGRRGFVMQNDNGAHCMCRGVYSKQPPCTALSKHGTLGYRRFSDLSLCG